MERLKKMVPTTTECRDVDARAATRSSIYLAAALYCDGASTSVRIRNISATGALVEGAAIPGSGALVQLVRGGLIVHALVAWSADGRCGLKFSGSIDPQAWRAAPTNSEQQRVDGVVRLVKAGAVPLPVPAQPSETDLGQGLSEDLRSVSELLNRLGEVLAGDDDVVTRHGSSLQHLDIAVQVIGAVNAIICGKDSDWTKLVALRRSTEQALRGDA